MSPKETFTNLLASLQLVKIQCLETKTQRTGDPVPNTDTEYTIQQHLGQDNPEPLDPSHVLFRVKFEIQIRSKDSPEFCQIAISYGLVFALKDKSTFDALWSQEANRKVFELDQLKKTIWPYFRQFVSEGLTRLELPNITLPWLI